MSYNQEIIIKSIIDKIELQFKNPYPPDIYLWDNQEKINITRGRFNQFVYEVVENTVKQVIEIIKEED